MLQKIQFLLLCVFYSWEGLLLPLNFHKEIIFKKIFIEHQHCMYLCSFDWCVYPPSLHSFKCWTNLCGFFFLLSQSHAVPILLSALIKNLTLSCFLSIWMHLMTALLDSSSILTIFTAVTRLPKNGNIWFTPHPILWLNIITCMTIFPFVL